MAINVGKLQSCARASGMCFRAEPLDLTKQEFLVKSSPILGSIVAAEIVLSPESKDTDESEVKARIRKDCAAALEKFQIPVVMNVVSEMETSLSGKLKKDKLVCKLLS